MAYSTHIEKAMYRHRNIVKKSRYVLQEILPKNYYVRGYHLQTCATEVKHRPARIVLGLGTKVMAYIPQELELIT